MSDLIESYRILVGELLDVIEGGSADLADHEGNEVAIADFIASNDQSVPALHKLLIGAQDGEGDSCWPGGRSE